MVACISSNRIKLNLIVIYRPPNNYEHSIFVDEFSELILNSDPKNTIIVGDLNYHFNSSLTPHSDFRDISDTLSLIQHISFPTHIKCNIIDYIFTNSSVSLISKTYCHSLVSDHFAIVFDLVTQYSQSESNIGSYRILSSIDIPNFSNDFNELVFPGIDISQMNDILSVLLDAHAPLVIPKRSNSHKAPLYNRYLDKLKRTTRCHERTFLKYRSEISYNAYRNARSEYRSSIKELKMRYIKSKISSLSINSRQFFNFTNNLTGRKQKPSLPNSPKEIICYEFIKYFHDKITSVCECIKSEKNKFGNKLNPLASIFILYSDSNLTYSFNSFNMTSTMEVYQLITTSTSTSPSDSIPISLIKKLAPILAPYYCSIVNFSLYSSIFPDIFKHAEITPLLKKTNLDCNKLSNY